MSKQNRLNEYNRLIKLQRHDDIPESLKDDLRVHLDQVRELYEKDRADDINGVYLRTIAGEGINGGYQSWSPVGPLLVFESGKDGNPEIYTLNADNGENLTRLTNNEKIDEWPCFSKDGARWQHELYA